MRPEKTSITKALKDQVAGSAYVILADYRGLNVAKTEDLRRRLSGVKARYRVINNSLFQHAAPELTARGFKDALTGPSAMVSGQGDVVTAAKVLKDFIKENKLPVIKIGALQGEVLTAGDIETLASLPGRETLLGRVVGTIAAPMTQLAGVLHQKVASLLYVLKAIEEKKSKTE
jgi:large subunit ribosomal protein L10